MRASATVLNFDLISEKPVFCQIVTETGGGIFNTMVGFRNIKISLQIKPIKT